MCLVREHNTVFPTTTRTRAALACLASFSKIKRAKGTKLRESAKTKEQREGVTPFSLSRPLPHFPPIFCSPQARSFARPFACVLVRSLRLKRKGKEKAATQAGTVRSEDEYTNHEATAPPKHYKYHRVIYFICGYTL